MATDKSFMVFIAEQMQDAGDISYRMMFGEYGLYLDGKFFALVCNNKLYLKPTEAGRVFIGEVVEAPPYPGAKNSFLIEEQVENRT